MPQWIKATGESNICNDSYDCGVYILANHKIWTKCEAGYYNNGSGKCSSIGVDNCIKANKDGAICVNN